MTSEEGIPRLLVIAGPNGSGKTTLTTRLREFGLDFGEYVNADEIALTLPSTPDRDRLAQIEADRRRRQLLDARRSFSFETVMSHPGKIEEMREAKALGFHFTFYFVGVSDPEINLSRVRHRVKMGGHDVPSDRVVARYYRTMELMPKAILLADQSFVFDNSDVRQGPQLAAEFKRTEHGINGVWAADPRHELVDSLLGDDLPPAQRGATSPWRWVAEYVLDGVKREAANVGVETNLP